MKTLLVIPSPPNNKIHNWLEKNPYARIALPINALENVLNTMDFFVGLGN